MKNLRKTLLYVFLLAGLNLLVLSAAAQTVIATTNSWSGTYIYYFGEPSIATFGQTFIPPAGSSVLTSFTVYIENVTASVNFQFYVMAWNGSEAAGPILYQSAATSTAGMSGWQPYTFNTGQLTMAPGATYVAFLSASGTTGQAYMASSATYSYANGEFVYNNNGTNFSLLTNSAWANLGASDLEFIAVFGAPPVILTSPANEAVSIGGVASFTVTATGPLPLAYQWFFNGTSLTNNAQITGSQSNVLTITNLNTSDAGIYEVRVSDNNGSTNVFATLAVTEAASYPQAYTFTTFAGVAKDGSADGVGSEAQFNDPFGVAVDGAGNVYVADTFNGTIRKVTQPGVVTTLAGLAGIFGTNDGTGSAARFNEPSGVTVDGAGNVYVADKSNNTIREVTQAGVVTTLAGLGGITGTNDGIGSAARFNQPFSVAVDSATNLYVADAGNNIIRELKRVAGTTNWVVSTIAGSAVAAGFKDGPGTNALFNYPVGVAVDSAGNLYIGDNGNDSIRMIKPDGTNWMATTLAGCPTCSYNGYEDGTGTNNTLFNDPVGVAVDSAGNVYVADQGNDVIREVSPVGQSLWKTTTIAGTQGNANEADGTGTNAAFYLPTGVAVDSAGDVYVADSGNCVIREINPAELVTTLAGSGTSYGSEDGAGSEARFFYPGGVAPGPGGNLYVADCNNRIIRKITSAGLVTTLAGVPGTYGQSDGVGDEAMFYNPQGLTVNNAGTIFVADTDNNTIRQVTPDGAVTTLAGLPMFDPNNNDNPVGGSADGNSSVAQFNAPTGVAVDGATNIYVADSGNNTIRKVSLVNGNWFVSTIAGLAGSTGTNDGMNGSARFNGPYGVAVDAATNVYVADQFNYTIRMVSPVPGTTNWVVRTIAGTPGIGGMRDGVGTNAQFGADENNIGPEGVAVDSEGNLYVADTASSTIRKITPVGANWVVSTIGGSPTIVGATDGAGSAALFDFPQGLTVDSAGNVYVADTENNTIRKGVYSPYFPANQVSFTPPQTTGQLTVTLTPPAAGGQWRFPWETAWRNSGATASNLVQGEYTVEFSTVPGYLFLPLAGPVAITNGATTFLTNQYYATISTVDSNNGGTLTVFIEPSPPGGAGWRFLGSTNAFFPPDLSTSVVAGTYLIEFAPVEGFVTPSSLSVQVQPGLPTALTVTYLLAQTPPADALLPVPVPSGNIDDLTDYPYGFNGQLQTDVGYGSGVAVQTNVVLTAAHLIFNDQTLSYVSQAYWFYQQEAGVFEPDPQAARGWYVLSGYAEQRTNDIMGGLGPDESSPQSRNLDVAALYFLSPVANEGYGGYLPSDATPNSWLTSAAEKLLVGYPVDGSQFGFTNIVNGQMYEIGPQPYALSPATDPVTDQQVYTASWFLSYPGNSGGPFYVEYDGYFYPAGVYLGTLFNGTVPYASAVRAIDSNVVSLITNAQNLVTTGTNNSGGGVITVSTGQGTGGTPGFVQVTIAPPAAFQAGGAWRFANQTNSSYSTVNPCALATTPTNAAPLQFKPIAGWNVPTNQTAVVTAGNLTTLTATYTLALASPQIQSARQSGNAFTFTWSAVSNQIYQIQFVTNLTQTNWITLTNSITATNSTTTISEPISNKTQQFYRVVAVP